MKVAFAGYYGMENFGDDLFAMACLQEAQHWTDGCPPVVVSKPITGVAARYSCAGVLAPLYNRHNNIGVGVRLAVHSLERLRSELFVYGGGSLFKHISATRKLGGCISRLSRGHQAAIGVSLGPFPTAKDEQEVARFLRSFEYLSVRDYASLEWALAQSFDFPVEMCGDLVGVLDFPQKAGRSHWQTLGVSLSQFGSFQLGDGSQDARAYVDLMDAVIDCCAVRGMAVRILDLNGHSSVGDRALSCALAEALERKGVQFELLSRRQQSSVELAAALSSCDAVVSGRLHGAIVSFLSDVPFALIEHEYKCTSFLDDIGQSPLLRFDRDYPTRMEIGAVLDRLIDEPIKPIMDCTTYRIRSEGHFRLAPWARSKEIVPA